MRKRMDLDRQGGGEPPYLHSIVPNPEKLEL